MRVAEVARPPKWGPLPKGRFRPQLRAKSRHTQSTTPIQTVAGSEDAKGPQPGQPSGALKSEPEKKGRKQKESVGGKKNELRGTMKSAPNETRFRAALRGGVNRVNMNSEKMPAQSHRPHESKSGHGEETLPETALGQETGEPRNITGVIPAAIFQRPSE